MAKTSASIADPRRPKRARPYTPPKVDPDDAPPDYASLLSLLFGIIGLMLRRTWASWIATFSLCSALSTMKKSEIDFKQLMTTIVFSLLGLFMNYFAPAIRKPS